MRNDVLSSRTEAESVGTGSIKQQVLQALQTDKQYRCGFVEEAIRSRITAQIKTMREQQDWGYKRFAEEIGKKVSWAYRLEDPNAAPPTIPTLLRVAEAFDIGLDVRFRPFSELLEDITTLGAESFSTYSFEEELNMGAFSRSRRRRKVRGSGCRRARAKVAAEKPRRALESNVVNIGSSRPRPMALAS
jgi:transcriptional regulator with XRE-family HTH domain